MQHSLDRKWLAWLPGAVAVGFIGLWLVLVALRISYPYELEWMEGGMLDHIHRVQQGKALYDAPSMEFGSYPYTPLYPWVCALFGSVAVDGFAVARSVSVLATIGVLFALCAAARQSSDGGRWRLAALLSAGLYAAGNGFTGGWGDIARIDALSTALGAWAFVVARGGAGARRITAAAGLASLAFLAKQSALALGVSLAGAFFVSGWRPAAQYLAVLGAMVGGTVAVLEAQTDHWFRFWTYDILIGAPKHEPLILGYWLECAIALGPALLVAVLSWMTGHWRLRNPRGGWDFGLLAAVPALFLAGWAGRSHQGGFENNLIPPLLATALVFGPAAAGFVAKGYWRGAVIAAAALAMLGYDPRPMVPSEEDRAAGDEFINRLRALEPPIFLPDHGYLARRAFGPETVPGIHGMMINDVLKCGQQDLIDAFGVELNGALAGREFGAVIVDELWHDDLPALRENYLPPVALWEAGDTRMVPVTGSPKRPQWLYLRRD